MIALAGVVLSAFSLRLAVSGVSPVLDRVREDVALDAASTGLLAMPSTPGFAFTGPLTAAAGAGALSGFGQGVGYLAGCVGPLISGVLFTCGGTWWASFGCLWLMLVALTAGVLLTGHRCFLGDRSASDRSVASARE